MNEDLIIVNSEVKEKEVNGQMKPHLIIYFYDKVNDKVICKERIINFS
jgi:hypothetical protein